MQNQSYVLVPVPECLYPRMVQFLASEMLKDALPQQTSPMSSPVALSPSSTIASTSNERANSAIGPDSGWAPEELRRVWLESGRAMRTTLELLAVHSGNGISSDQIAAALGHQKRGHIVAGTMGAFGRRMKHRHNGRWPFTAEWNAVNARWEYTMSHEIAAMLIEALNKLKGN